MSWRFSWALGLGLALLDLYDQAAKEVDILEENEEVMAALKKRGKNIVAKAFSNELRNERVRKRHKS